MRLKTKSELFTSSLIIFACAFFIRFFYYTFLKSHYFFFDHPSTDVAYFQQWARDIASGNWLGNKTFYGLPLFAYFLAGLYRLTLFQIDLVPYILITIGAANCVLTFLIAQKLFTNKAAWFSAFYIVINFSLIHYDTICLPITLAIFINLSIIWLLLNQSNIKKTYEWFILGILIGLGVLIDGKLLIFTGLFLIYDFFSKQKSFLWIKQRALIVLGIVLIIFSVGLRNKIVGGSWVWITAQSGLSFYVGNNETSTGIYNNPSFIRPDHQGQDEDQIIVAEQLSRKQLTDKEVSIFWQNEGLKFIQKNPQQFLKLLTNKFICFFQDNENAWDIDLILQRPWKYQWDLNPFWIMCPLSILGILFSFTRKNRDNIYPILLIVSQLIFTLIYFLTYRHRSVVIPIFIIYEGFFLAWLIEQITEKRFSYFLLALLLIFLSFQISPRKIFLEPQEWNLLNYSKSGPILVSQGKNREAENMYQLALSINPNDLNSLYNLGSLFTSEKKYDQAIPIFKKILDKQPYQVDALYNLAYCFKEIEKFEIATKLFLELMSIQPESIDAKIQLFQLYLKQQNCAQSQMYADQIIELKPNFKAEIQKLMQTCR